MRNTSTGKDEKFMHQALLEAEAALQRGDRPIGAVIVHNARIIACGSNCFRSGKSEIAHAELNALQACADFLQQHGSECTLYTTCEPCVMCLGAIVMANIREIVFGMPDNHIRPGLVIEHVPYIQNHIRRYTGGVLQDECVVLFRRFSEDEAELCLKGRRSTR